ncbi:MAG: hypothetical protein AB1706_10265 [Pseudomonadota bacterium]
MNTDDTTKKMLELAEQVAEMNDRIEQLEDWRERVLQACDTYEVQTRVN